MSTFQYGGQQGGFVEIDKSTGMRTALPKQPQEVAVPTPPPAKTRTTTPATQATSADPGPLDGMGPGEVVKAAKARLRHINKELKRHAKLIKEKAELERLIAAAKGTKPASVRPIQSARRAK